MKYIILLLTLLISTALTAKWPEGAWKLISQNGQADKTIVVTALVQDNYLLVNAHGNDHSFEWTWGGPVTFLNDTEMEIKYDFNTKNPDLVGKIQSFKIYSEDKSVELGDDEGISHWEMTNDGTNELTGNWVFTGRETNGEIKRYTPGDRRTLKMLTGNHFQWVAFNSATGEFSGTGGGSYTAENGIYTEKIEFFSRDNKRVGAKLSFDYKIHDRDWHHSGKSSKGEPMYEIWSPYNEYAEKL